MKRYRILDFRAIGDDRGWLVPLESNRAIPFDIKRVYYIWGTQKDIVRGKHAHRDLEQVIVCIAGSCDFILDDGHERKTIRLDNPAKGLYIEPKIWGEFTNFSSDCVVMVLASDYYDEADYIRNYDEFKNILEDNIK